MRKLCYAYKSWKCHLWSDKKILFLNYNKQKIKNMNIKISYLKPMAAVYFCLFFMARDALAAVIKCHIYAIIRTKTWTPQPWFLSLVLIEILNRKTCLTKSTCHWYFQFLFWWSWPGRVWKTMWSLAVYLPFFLYRILQTNSQSSIGH